MTPRPSVLRLLVGALVSLLVASSEAPNHLRHRAAAEVSSLSTATAASPPKPTRDWLLTCNNCVADDNTFFCYDDMTCKSIDGDCKLQAVVATDCANIFAQCRACAINSNGKFCYENLQCLLSGQPGSCKHVAFFPDDC